MSRVSCIAFVALVAVVLCALNGRAEAQNMPVQCSAASSITFNSSLTGDWYEAARYPAEQSVLNCVEADIYQDSNSNYLVNVTYATSTSALYQNQTISSPIVLNSTASSGFFVNNTINNQNLNQTTLKLLETDYVNYAFICGYNASANDSTSFGIILTRNRPINSTYLNNLYQKANSSYSSFNTSSSSLITQSQACYTNAAAQNVPIFSAVIALIYAFLKFVN